MIEIMEMKEEDVFYAIENGEFPDNVLLNSGRVVIIMTQDWCPQWIHMAKWLYDLDADEEISIFEIVYNTKNYFRDFMKFKESVFNNYSVPYLRFYKNGKLTNETNYISEKKFKSLLGA